MVAYSFKNRFVPDIQAYLKMQTVRANRKRHARPGEMLQLYCGMRTKHCFKIVPDVRCLTVETIEIDVGPQIIHDILIGNQRVDRHSFAVKDGFESVFDMHEFWVKAHGTGNFSGVLIRWESN